MAVTVNFNGDVSVDGVFVGNTNSTPGIIYMSEAELLEGFPVIAKGQGPTPSGGGAGSQDSGEGFAHDFWVPHDPDPDWHPEPHGTVGSPEYGQPGFYDIDDWYAEAARKRPDYYNEAFTDPEGYTNPAADFINRVTQPLVDTFPEWGDDPSFGEDPNFGQGEPMAADGAYGNGMHPSMCKLALQNKALIAIVQAGAVTSTGNPLLGVVGSILTNGLKRLEVGPDWGRRIFGTSQDADVCQRNVEEAIACGYLRIPKPNFDGSLPANMQITLDPDSPRATLQWRKKSTSYARKRAPVRRAPARRSYRRRAA